MKEIIEKRLAELYKQQANLLDSRRVWIQPSNGTESRTELTNINRQVIIELENLWKLC